uniref:Putative terminase n=1 Tax=viral metagenome TaxID=1070528 RepID=A0A6M3IJ64_9ZZZZ
MDKELKNILSQCSISTRMTAKTLFPERFYLPFADQIHGKIFNLIDGPDNKVAIAAPRGWGKTSVVALAFMARYILFNHTGFICYINKSHDAASLQTENLRRELVTNRMIKHFFGSFKTREVENKDFEETFSKKAWVAYNTLVWPRGAGQQVRGVLFKNDRPGLIVIDDLEDPEKISNDEIRKKWYEWLYADVIKAVPRVGPESKRWKIVYIDTLKHEDSVLQKLLESPEWKSVRLEACDDNFKSTAPEFISDEDVQKEWQEHVDSGQTDVFFRELRNLPISTKDSAFRQEYFHYYNVPDDSKFGELDLKKHDTEIQSDQNIETVVLLDPAKTVKIHSAESAIIGVGIDLTSAKLYIRDAISEKMYPDEIYDALFGMGIRLNAKVLGIEETSLNEFIRQPIKNEMFRRGSFFELIWLKARGGMKKELRVKELVPYYRGGYIYHNKTCATVKKLEQQLLMFPRSRLWDLMDCLAYIIEMLELGERYFSPKENPDDIESEYAELDYDKPIEDWRYL